MPFVGVIYRSLASFLYSVRVGHLTGLKGERVPKVVNDHAQLTLTIFYDGRGGTVDASYAVGDYHEDVLRRVGEDCIFKKGHSWAAFCSIRRCR